MTGEDDVTLRLSAKTARIIGQMVPLSTLLSEAALNAGLEYYNELQRVGLLAGPPNDIGGVDEV